MQTDTVDWDALRKEYLQEETSYRALSRKYNIPYATLARRAKREGWAQRRWIKTHKPQSMTISDVAGELSQMLYLWMAELDHPAVGDIDKAAGALKKLQDLQRSDEEQEDRPIILTHHIPRQADTEDGFPALEENPILSEGEKPLSEDR